MNFGMDNDEPYEDYDDWGGEEWPMDGPPGGNFRNNRYSNAFGNYRGGYGQGRGYGGPPPLFGPPNPGPPGPVFMWGRGFGPRGPPVKKSFADDRAVKYMIRCGVAKEHLKNLPRDLLKLIEPQYCGLCGHNFESFPQSRLHYISRNHMKNQKKWLSQHTDGFRRAGSRDIPLKSRELYCELCDVHITSKTHAESHYAGKPHRAIVEGRKVPKNPYLLQSGMESRVQQLIRREKRFYKSEEAEVTEAPKEPKPTQPELYCEICKTNVTCSEQMTMHLNGKRHLSKEKQHILKMMKGGADEVKAEPKDDAEEDEPEEDEPEEDEPEVVEPEDNEEQANEAGAAATDNNGIDQTENADGGKDNDWEKWD